MIVSTFHWEKASTKQRTVFQWKWNRSYHPDAVSSPSKELLNAMYGKIKAPLDIDKTTGKAVFSTKAQAPVTSYSHFRQGFDNSLDVSFVLVSVRLLLSCESDAQDINGNAW